METERKIYQIGEVSRRLGISADTLRYYEKIGLMPKVARRGSGIRCYTDKDLSRLRFIKRAQAMNFSLNEIGALLQMRENPGEARQEARELTRSKLDAVEQRLAELEVLRNELRLLLNLCAGSEAGCPILKRLDGEQEQVQRR